MARTAAGRWKRKAAVAVALAATVGGLTVGVGTASANGDGGQDCPDQTWTDEGFRIQNNDPCPPDEPWPPTDPPTEPEQPEQPAEPEEPAEPEMPPAVDEPPVMVQEPGVASISGSPLCVNGSGTINLTLSNIAGDLPVVFVATHPSTGVQATVAVGAMSNQQLTLLGTKTGTVHVSITADGDDRSRAFEVTCPVVEKAPAPETASEPPVDARVLSAAVTPDAPVLPATGSDHTSTMTLLAAGLLGAGAATVAGARRRRPS